jgi:hypothetical protein
MNKSRFARCLGNIYIRHQKLTYRTDNRIIIYIANSKTNSFTEFVMYTFEETNLENEVWLWGRNIYHAYSLESRLDKSVNME